MKKIMSLLLCAALLLSMTAMAFAENAAAEPVESQAPTETVGPTESPESTESPATPENPESTESPAPEGPAGPSVKEEEKGADETGKAATPTRTIVSDVPYVVAENNVPTHDATEVETTTTAWDTAANEGWYVVSKEVTISDRITVTGAVNLILADGAKLTAEKGIHVPENSSLTIWCQEKGTGELVSKAEADSGNAGIGGNESEVNGAVTIHGGVITATGAVKDGKAANGIGCGAAVSGGTAGTITISGGTVTAQAGDDTASAIIGVPVLDGYLHMTYGGTEKNTDPVEWSSNSKSDWTWSWVKLQPIVELKISIELLEPDEGVANLYGSNSCTLKYKAHLEGKLADGSTVTLPYDGFTWAVKGKLADSTTISRDGVLTVGADEDADSLQIVVSCELEGEKAEAAASVAVVHWYAVQFLPRNGEDPIIRRVTRGQTVEKDKPDDPTRNGWTFTGWYKDEDCTEKFDFTTPITSSQTLYAGWTQKTDTSSPGKSYRVTFDANGGTCLISYADTDTNGKLKTDPPSATKSGQYFAGWYTEKTGGVKITKDYVFKADTTVYARWSNVPVTGDENDIVLWAVLLGVSALAVIGGGVYIFRKSRKKKQ